MNVKDIKSNGINWSAPANEIRSILETAISIYRMRHSTEDIFSSFPDSSLGYYDGIRFNSNDTVASRITSAITLQAKAKQNLLSQRIFDETSESQFNQLKEFITGWFNGLTAKEVDVLILDGLRDCAEADYWYKYEKQWD